MSARYLTTTLPYVNADPHIGFALEIVQADVLARSWRATGDEVFFSTGTDEHGQKIQEAAEKAGQDVHAFVDHYAGEFRRLKDALGLDEELHFIRTTAPNHISAAQEIWKRCFEKGDIEKRTFTGLYCVGCEAFKTEHELNAEKRCQLHPTTELQEVSEENYFFKLSKYQDRLHDYLKQPSAIVPEWRRAEAQLFVENGLEDFSISREKGKLSWGIPVPGDDSQVMYVWFDALANYISTLGWPEDAEGNFKKFWEEGKTLQVAGKDQVRFQSIMWQAMLMSADIRTTDTVFYHGFITSGGQKMSKSLGNVINPLELVAKYGTDAVRYILLRHISPTQDSDLTLEAIHDHYTANLTNGLGNLVARVMQLAQTYLPKPVPIVCPIDEPLQDFKFNEAMDALWARMSAIDQRVTTEKPFELIKTDPEAGQRLITELVQQLYGIGLGLRPYLPATAEKIVQAVKENKKPENLFPRI